MFNKIAVLHLWPESLNNICKRVQFLSKFLGEDIMSNIYNFLEIDGDEEEDIDYEDETEEEEKEEDASEN